MKKKVLLFEVQNQKGSIPWTFERNQESNIKFETDCANRFANGLVAQLGVRQQNKEVVYESIRGLLASRAPKF